MDKKKIICIVGESGSGKTSIALDLKDRYNVGHISSYTTREMRPGETNGVEHVFVRKEDVPDKKEMFAYTEFGGHEYWTTWEQINKHNVCTYVIDEKGIEFMKSRLDPDRYEVVMVKVYRNDTSTIDADRKNRDLDRIVIPDEEYDIILHNDSTIQNMTEQIVDYFLYKNEHV